MFHRTPEPFINKSCAGIHLARHFTRAGTSPYDMFEWELRSASIKNEKDEVIFEQTGIETPKRWSQLATNVVANKYFRGTIGDPKRENSIRGLIHRVVDTITDWGLKQGYFASVDDAHIFGDELAYLILDQRLAFNSPVWFNVGVEKEPQCSACFINSVSDDMGSILDLCKTEGMLFKFGSGTGTNFSPLRSSLEPVGFGGNASGPVSFMRGFDAFAGVIKSGGKTRRAAKMVILNVSHPDILKFINCKADEEHKAHVLIDAGYDGSFNGEAYGSVFFQNSNNSVRVTDEFMQAVKDGGKWRTYLVTQPDKMAAEYDARNIFHDIAVAAHKCGDPGLQFDTIINRWNTCSLTNRIRASNPCSEYMFLDDSACNLASLNLRRFQLPDGSLDILAFKYAVFLSILAQEIIVDNSGYPTEKIARNSYKFRPLGLGFANLGAFLMALGLPYDSTEGRAWAASITSLMTAQAYASSARIAAVVGSCEGFKENEQSFMQVMADHWNENGKIPAVSDLQVALQLEAGKTWEKAINKGSDHGYRNCQTTVLAPTGTIAFMMDCDTTGIEPDIALVKYKKLVGGGMLKIVNQTTEEALRRLGYDQIRYATGETMLERILAYIDQHDTIEGSVLKDEHLPIFDCAFKPKNGKRFISWQGHIRMMAACQPFLSGAISKTVNMPTETTVDDIKAAYMMSWELGLKSVAVYRNGCKRSQPLNTSKDEPKVIVAQPVQVPSLGLAVRPEPVRYRLPDERDSKTVKFSVGGHEGYMHVGMYEDGAPGEVFFRMAKEGSTINGLMDTIGTLMSLLLQYGVPLMTITKKLANTKFEPSGWTTHPKVRRATSLVDFASRWLALKFGREPVDQGGEGRAQEVEEQQIVPVGDSDAPLCHECGALMIRSGSCHRCNNCGATSGCS